MKHLLIAITFLFAGAYAQADSRSSPEAWACSMGFSGRSTGVKLIVGYYRYHAKGNLNCVSTMGEKVSLPIKVSMHAKPISANISLSRMEMKGVTGQFSLLNNHPEALLGRYAVLQGSVAFVGGVGAMTAVHADLPSVTMNISLQLVKGFGFNLGINRMVVALDESRMN